MKKLLKSEIFNSYVFYNCSHIEKKERERMDGKEKHMRTRIREDILLKSVRIKKYFFNLYIN